MQTCVYMSNRRIQAAVGNAKKGSISVKRLYETLAPEGCIINGVITAEEELAAHLKEFWKENHLAVNNVCLVLHSSQFMSKTFQVPAMNVKKTLEYIPREFPGVSGAGGSVYGYYEIDTDKKKGMREVFATRMEREFLDSYTRLFASIGVKVTCVRAALGSVVSVLHRMAYFKDRTCILQIQDEDNLTSILMHQGKYCYSSMNRTFSEHGTPSYGVEVARNISGILQFASAQKLENAVTDVTWAGFSEGDIQVCSESLLQMDNTLRAGSFMDDSIIRSKEEDFGSYLFPICGLIPLEDAGNLFIQYKKTSERSLKRKSLMKQITPVILLLLVMLVITGFFGVHYWLTSRKLEEVRSYNESPEVLEQSARYDEVEAQMQWEQMQKAALMKAARNIESYPYFNSSITDVIESCTMGEVTFSIKSFDAQTGVISVDTAAPDVEIINQFIDRLEEKDIFERLDYTGYTWSDESGMWTINLVCYLSEMAGK